MRPSVLKSSIVAISIVAVGFHRCLVCRDDVVYTCATH